MERHVTLLGMLEALWGALSLLVGLSAAALGIVLDDGARLSRCLRCDAWVRSEPPGADARYEVVPPPASLRYRPAARI